MEALLYLIPIALFLGATGLAAFVWALRSGQFEDLDGAAHRILFDDDDPLPDPAKGAGEAEEPVKTAKKNGK
ncbi:cytochrome oxidase maturation protein cbb3-type [Rhodospirillum rubrum F11]|uniref:Cytochrome oxidase maturation protein cbb3-type n=1 Tax=Rhodospirillum rubrum (strain ATCC 11170 / ATH 1.1.1 / DSM 467 / LMG 4362 / NCIMB 8255 / S1) TaxID=269796 RepID=Q2RP28_RHORT|nr:cbb3-type cytochrome oxidase assembly protein CcoS [Rhodospirillum rubrum]ABC24117.1 Cytochrome oxidase maturation protein cbb3-type [Rhodospirillum rubrum ATCC 11170]AEO49866.1 cytochrome oxidase maturation protein cbb3-type [Rhodospirillum rubrum F11]MBK5955830.1 cbb3-type cytochrome oxidase assembly protein CcoS [Rhodospirillum rubrum]QXG80061.1 cbb3-type cytochrome oxidase assembly protein CcoS [Rhodospirillum rubrum]